LERQKLKNKKHAGQQKPELAKEVKKPFAVTKVKQTTTKNPKRLDKTRMSLPTVVLQSTSQK
jgi:hypothetical protein